MTCVSHERPRTKRHSHKCGFAEFDRIIKAIKEMIPNVEEDRFLQVLFENNFEPLSAITFAVKNQAKLVFHTRSTSIRTLTPSNSPAW